MDDKQDNTIIERAVDSAALDSLLARTQQLARQIDALS